MSNQDQNLSKELFLKEFLNVDNLQKLKSISILQFFGDHRRSKTVFEFYVESFWGSLSNMKSISFDRSRIQLMIDTARNNNKNFICFRPLDSMNMDDIQNKNYGDVKNYSVDHDPYNSYYPIAMFEFIRDNMGNSNLEVTKGSNVIVVDSNGDGLVNYKDEGKKCTMVIFRIQMNNEIYYFDIIDDPSVTYP